MEATADMLAALDPGELLVRITRDGWTIPPDHVAIAQANAAIRGFRTTVGTYRGRPSNEAQAECLEGAT